MYINPLNYSSQYELVYSLGQYKLYTTPYGVHSKAIELVNVGYMNILLITVFKHKLETDLPKKLNSLTISTQSSTTLPDSRFDQLLTDSKFYLCIKSDERPSAFHSTIKA
ncbi:unnamed protein product [Clonostachys chloroleuca]|uniref:Uncharacterized protein n=1 Tax=Clonostachys chloroleuca TaxID=1926264 RepID=A0AA35LWN3_9HYPO|nr:unnamed protein product [Clonostachys chloroleuca]